MKNLWNFYLKRWNCCPHLLRRLRLKRFSWGMIGRSNFSILDKFLLCGYSPLKCKKKKNALHLSVNVFSTNVLIGDTIFYVSNWRRDRHFTWSSESREGLVCCSTKEVPSFFSYFKTLSIGPARESNPRPPVLQSTRSTDWANTAAFVILKS